MLVVQFGHDVAQHAARTANLLWGKLEGVRSGTALDLGEAAQYLGLDAPPQFGEVVAVEEALDVKVAIVAELELEPGAVPASQLGLHQLLDALVAGIEAPASVRFFHALEGPVAVHLAGEVVVVVGHFDFDVLLRTGLPRLIGQRLGLVAGEVEQLVYGRLLIHVNVTHLAGVPFGVQRAAHEAAGADGDPAVIVEVQGLHQHVVGGGE